MKSGRALIVAFLAFAIMGAPRRGVAQAPKRTDVRAVVNVASANLRSQPSTAGTIVGRAVRGDSVRVLEARTDGWTRVRRGVRDVWLRESFLRRIEAPTAAPEREAPATALPAAAPTPMAPDPGVATGESTPQVMPADAEREIDPRIAGRGNAARTGRSTVPASRDDSRLGAMIGVATGPYQAFTLNGPAARVYLRQRVSGSPIAGRLDAEVSRMTAQYGLNGASASYRVVDARLTGGMEYGVPVHRLLEFAIVGSVGVARQSIEVGLDLDGTDSDGTYTHGEWRLAHDVGVGAKLGRRLHAAFHFFSSDGAPYRLYVGVRL